MMKMSIFPFSKKYCSIFCCENVKGRKNKDSLIINNSYSVKIKKIIHCYVIK